MRQPNSTTFARALGKTLDRYKRDTGYTADMLHADSDTKFEKRFRQELLQRGVKIIKSFNEQKNAFVERAGRTIKKSVATLSRNLNADWPDVLKEVERIHNRETLIPGTKFTPIQAYEGENYSELLQTLMKQDSKMHIAMYNVPVKLSKRHADEMYRFRVGQQVTLDSTALKPRLRGPIVKVSEQRTIIWHKGKVLARKVVISNRGNYISRYYCRIPALRTTSWFPESRMKPRVWVDTDTEESD